MSAIDSLFKSFSLKSLETQNRVVMAPMTRNHSPDNVPSDASVEYYGAARLVVLASSLPRAPAPTILRPMATQMCPIFTVKSVWRAGKR